MQDVKISRGLRGLEGSSKESALDFMVTTQKRHACKGYDVSFGRFRHILHMDGHLDPFPNWCWRSAVHAWA